VFSIMRNDSVLFLSLLFSSRRQTRETSLLMCFYCGLHIYLSAREGTVTRAHSQVYTTLRYSALCVIVAQCPFSCFSFYFLLFYFQVLALTVVSNSARQLDCAKRCQKPSSSFKLLVAHKGEWMAQLRVQKNVEKTIYIYPLPLLSEHSSSA
jgi:hypothetical protein